MGVKLPPVLEATFIPINLKHRAATRVLPNVYGRLSHRRNLAKMIQGTEFGRKTVSVTGIRTRQPVILPEQLAAIRREHLPSGAARCRKLGLGHRTTSAARRKHTGNPSLRCFSNLVITF